MIPYAENYKEALVLNSLGKSDLRAIFPGTIFDRERAKEIGRISIAFVVNCIDPSPINRIDDFLQNSW